MFEPICYDPDWERYNADPYPRTEDDWDNMRYERQDEDVKESQTYAEAMADLIEFESDEDRDEYIAWKFMERMKELNGVW